MARNRKRAKERRVQRDDLGLVSARDRDDGAPDPIEHAAPDVELAEAQLALGRPELAEETVVDDDAFDEEFAEASDGGAAVSAARPSRRRGGLPQDRGAVAVPGAVAEPRVSLLSRLITFLQGSWRELQRVQWPDRRQVMQATSVVIGFVIVAGVFLGVADYLSTQLMNYILK